MNEQRNEGETSTKKRSISQRENFPPSLSLSRLSSFSSRQNIGVPDAYYLELRGPVVTDPLPSIRLLSDGGRIPGPTETAVLFHESGGGESGGGREEIR